MTFNIILKNLAGLFLNSLLLFLGWYWIIMPLFPTLPFVSYWIFVVFELTRERLGKKVGDFSIVYSTRRIAPKADPWWGMLLTYGFIIGCMWLVNYYLLTPLDITLVP